MKRQSYPELPLEKSRREKPTKGTQKPPSHCKAGPARGRRARVWKACERCRFKKTKCDGEPPCNRCKDDGFVCTAGRPRKGVYNHPLKGYVEVLECHQLTLIATVRKLYAMVRGGQAWQLSEPNLNDRGLPIVHSIADKLGCILPHSDADLAVRCAFPEDEAGMAELASELQEQHQHHTDHVGSSRINDDVVAPRYECGTLSDEHDFDSHPEMTPDSCAALSTHHYAKKHAFASTSQPMGINQGATACSPSPSSFPGFTVEEDYDWPESTCTEGATAAQYLEQVDGFPNALVRRGGSGLGDSDFVSKSVEPLTWTQMSDIMMDMGDPMFFALLKA